MHHRFVDRIPLRWLHLQLSLVMLLSLVPIRESGATLLEGVLRSSRPVIETLSSDPGSVTGGDVLVEITVRSRRAQERLHVEVRGQDVTDQFRRVGRDRFRGLIHGLPEGNSTIIASTCERNRFGRCKGLPLLRGEIGLLTVKNFSIAGPVFSGTHQEPYFCETEEADLGPALDEDCFAPTQVVYRYRTLEGMFAELDDPADRPEDLATLQVDGVELPYIVRLERGVINRGIYEIAVLHDGADPSPFRSEIGWNEKAVLTFGGGCNVGYHQGDSTAGVLSDAILSRGYAVVSNSLFVNDTNCSPIVAAETALMTKERLIETYGPLVHSIGSGGSGGAIMQYTISHGYPGVLDGILPSISFADAFSNSAAPDCLLLVNYLGTPSGSALTLEQRTAIGGHQVFGTCRAWVASFADRVDATRGCDEAVPTDIIYDPVTNPDGVRCALAEHVVKQLGRDPVTGFARGTYDNGGVQYGLGALNAGILSVDEFLDLNEGMGGFDADGLVRAARSMADPGAIRAAFETGLISAGNGGLKQTPTIDLRTYTDQLGGDAFGDIHTSFWSVAIHERLVRDGVDPRSHSRWIFQRGDNRFPEALDAMDAWLSAIAADKRRGTLAQRVARNRPPDAAPGCWPDPAGPKLLDLDACYAGPFPFTGDLRTVAGAPITTDVTCNTKVPERGDYPVALSDTQWERLLAIFPNGVCDYTQLPGVGQVPIRGTFQSFE